MELCITKPIVCSPEMGVGSGISAYATSSQHGVTIENQQCPQLRRLP